ncbi:MAG: VWA domain-containing protein [Thermoguttaceae bacterium]
MFTYHLSFASPCYLAILAIVPVLAWLSFRRLAALGPWRRWVVLFLRGLLIALVVLTLAEVQFVQTNDRLTVIYLLDQSSSIPAEQRQQMIDYVNADIRARRHGKDRVGVVVFGRDAAVEIPPFDDNVQLEHAIESVVDPECTSLAAAMKLAQALFPEDAAKRIVLVSDGNQNLGNAAEQAQALSAAGVGIDAVPIRYSTRADVIVERVALPPDVRRGEPFDLRVVVTNTAVATARDPGNVRGRLELRATAGGRTDTLSEQAVVLPPGKRVFTIRQKIDAADFYTYEARFHPDRPEDDAFAENNRATAFTHVQGKGQVLLIEDYEHPGEFGVLADRLRRQGLEIEVRPSNQLFSTLAELQPYDTVLLANVPREHFTDAQIAMLARNTQQLGAGLVMLGGPNSFGAGGWTNTEVEQAMPVDFQIKSFKVVPRGALVMIMHASEIAQGNYWQTVIAKEAIKALGPQDYCGIIHWSGTSQWLWAQGLLTVGPNRDQMMARLDRMTPGDMPDFDPTMALAARGFSGLPDAAVKHLIIISDGDPSPPNSGTITTLKNLGVTVSTAAVGAHQAAGSPTLSAMSAATGGKYWVVSNPNNLPRIFQREARRVARPLVWDKRAVHPQVALPSHEILSGVTSDIPPLTGFVMTSRKEGNPLTETLLTSPEPAGDDSNTLLAGWTYGLGKAVAFTSDAGARWTTGWTGEPMYDKFFGQMVRWSMRPAGGSGKFTVTSEVIDGQVRVVVNALDKNDEFLNFLSMGATAVGPDMKPVSLKIEQTSPGRYVGSLPAREAGSYFVTIAPGVGQAPIRAGVTVPYSDEFRDRTPNDVLLEQLATVAPKGGPAGRLIELPPEFTKRRPATAIKTERLAKVDPFRHDLPKATNSQDAWHYFLLASCCVLFCDVFCRRVHVNFAWVPPLAAGARDWVLRRQPKAAVPEFMQRLQSRKAEVSDQLDQRHAAARFEPVSPPAGGVDPLDEASQPVVLPDRPAAAPTLDKPKAEEASYTERLLRAKKKVWEDKK